MKIVACNSNLPLAEAISKETRIPLCKSSIRRFADGEIFAELLENVRGEDVFVIQSTCAPTNDHLMELLIVLDALRRGSAKRITAVIPYFGYARQERKSGPRTPISAKLVANLLTEAGANRVLTMDLHAMQIQGFFDIPTDNLYAAPLFVQDIKERLPKTMEDFSEETEVVIVSPDVGGVVRARQLARRLNADLAIIDKRRERAGVSEVMNVIGNVKDKYCILVDDIIDSGGSLCNAAAALIKHGAAGVEAYITHGVLTGKAVERVSESDLRMLTLTDTIPETEQSAEAPNIRYISTARLISRAINAIAEESSISILFE
ncbi:ribose-phosphate pyrophosphokinase [Acetobacteraceae bacterium]|nr:ribose-phosphate pyrophosphokinase [Acetobacteraceae bacterium]